MGFHIRRSQANDSPFLRDRRHEQQDRRSNPLINPIQLEWKLEEETRSNNEKPDQTDKTTINGSQRKKDL